MILWTILTPGLGDSVVGLGLTLLVSASAGSGILQVKLGLEEPTLQISAGVSSMLARTARLGLETSRRMTLVGITAQIAAAFNAPIAAISFTRIFANLGNSCFKS